MGPYFACTWTSIAKEGREFEDVRSSFVKNKQQRCRPSSAPLLLFLFLLSPFLLALRQLAPSHSRRSLRLLSRPALRDFLSDLSTRFLSSSVLVAAVSGLLLRFEKKGFAAIVLLAQTCMVGEITRLMRDEAGDANIPLLPLQRVLWYLGAFSYFTLPLLLKIFSVPVDDQLVPLVLSFVLCGVSLVLSVVTMSLVSPPSPSHLTYYLSQLSFSVTSFFLLVGSSSCLLSTVASHGLLWGLLPLLLVSVNDSAAYLFGTLLGRTPLLPRLSPRKSVEGFLLSLLLTVYLSLRFGPSLVGLSPLPSLSFGLLASLLCPLGGALASGLKRSRGAKTFGQAIPGHGGVLDRCDCGLVMSAAAYALLRARPEWGTMKRGGA